MVRLNCDNPYYVRKGKGSVDPFPVPCGKCPLCVNRRVNQWVYRLIKESERHEYSHFVTLTYNTDYVPITKNGYMTLKKRDLQLYFKRLRKAGYQFRYYAVGEYGTKNRRPHYHIIFCGNIDDVEQYHAHWLQGQVVVGTVTSSSIAYTLKYMCNSDHRFLHSRDDRMPQFSLMSKRLGDNYLTPAVEKYHKQDLSRVYCTALDGVRVSMPRYYKQKLFDENEREKQIGIILSALERSDDERRDKFMREFPEKDYEQALEEERFARSKKFRSHLKNRLL